MAYVLELGIVLAGVVVVLVPVLAAQYAVACRYGAVGATGYAVGVFVAAGMQLVGAAATAKWGRK